MSKINCIEPVSRTSWLLIKQGLLPSQDLQKFQVTKLIPHYLIYAFMINLLTVQLTNAINESNAMLINRMICVLIPVVNLIAKALTVQKNKKCFISIMRDIKSDAFNIHSEKQNEHIELIDTVSKVVLRYFILLISIFLSIVSLLPIVVNTKILIPNPINLGKYEIFYQIIHLLTTCYFGINSACLDFLYLSLMGICLAQLNILQDKLVNVHKTSNGTCASIILDNKYEYISAEEIIKECVILHEKINRFVTKLSVLLSFPLFIQYTCGCFTICNAVLQLTIVGQRDTANVITILSYTGIVFSQMTMYHWLGNEITSKSDKIIEACYLSNWYELDIGSRKFLILLMERAKRSLIIQLYQLIHISLESLAMIFRSSYSVFALMKPRYNKSY